MIDDQPPTLRYTRRVTQAVGIGAVILLLIAALWYVSHILLLFFAAIMVAILVDALAMAAHRHLPIPRVAALIIVIALAAVLLPVIFWWLIGSPMANQLAQLFQRLPEDIEQLISMLENQPWGHFLLEQISNPERIIPDNPALFGRISGFFSTAVGTVTSLAIVVLMGFYLALNPDLYLNGVIALVPPAHRSRAREVMAAMAHALRWWLIGRFATMAAVGVLTVVGLWIAGIPLVLALGLISGLLSFVPFIGTVVAALLALLVAWGQSPLATFYVLIVVSVVQFLEGNFITPLIQKRVVSLPPAVLLAAQLSMGVLFGLTGVALATPLAVVAIVFVQMVYVEDILGDRVQVLGEHGVPGEQ